jgi:hypothetical protein
MYPLLETRELLCANVFGYLEEVLLLFKELLYNLSILDLCSTITFCTWCVILVYYDILSIWNITFGVRALFPGFFFSKRVILEF